MPRIDGRGSGRLLLSLVVVVLVLGFTPIARGLLKGVGGSFAPSPYSALAATNPSDAAAGILSGEIITVFLTNRSGHTKTYHWSATQGSALISLGEQTLANGRTTTLLVPSRGAVPGVLRIALTGTNVFVTVHMLKS
jgi:hypothetical protein